jgi:hypothetical protein
MRPAVKRRLVTLAAASQTVDDESASDAPLVVPAGIVARAIALVTTALLLGLAACWVRSYVVTDEVIWVSHPRIEYPEPRIKEQPLESYSRSTIAVTTGAGAVSLTWTRTKRLQGGCADR